MTLTTSHISLISKENEWPLEEINGLPLLSSPLLNEFGNLKHAFTTRLGGNSPAPLNTFNLGRHMPSDESRADAMSNRRALCIALGLAFESIVVPAQVHSKNVVLADATRDYADVDGVTVTKKNIPVLLHFADCVPIVLFAPKKNVVSVVHAGWRGTAAKIVIEALELMRQECQCQPEDLVAAIGPAIGPCCYPTSNDAAEKLQASLPPQTTALSSHIFATRNAQCHPNLKAINALQLHLQGVSRIDISNACTACRPELFYSHRRSNGQTGRQGVIACLV